ncbi:unnamed protein product [Lepeophtheirus salmonis]|uniref:(salmon louse) hypothetical protein n=1 Tax=Lepeophtheirus salmonis TaxID=72036 RepID=A0A7R8CNT5_LEPSM|nr:unnamed protein product [Lepeophtheirus salmonis]CAF2878683.1 unnamed protein product [Lepeophtheirus salmonis]
MEHLFVIAIVLLCQLFGVDGNLRCYSCAPCDEFEYFAGDISRFQTDCLLDRHCLKISGTTRDIYGYEHTISVRGCPFSFSLSKIARRLYLIHIFCGWIWRNSWGFLPLLGSFV